MEDNDDFLASNQDNTKVFRIMNDFQDFMKQQSTNQSLHGNSSLNLHHLSSKSSECKTITSSKTALQKTLSNSDLQVKINQMEKDHISEKQALVKANIKLEEDRDTLVSKMKRLEEKCDTLYSKNKHLTEQNIDMIDKIRICEEKSDCSDELEKQLNEISSLKNEKERLSEEVIDLEATNNELSNDNQILQCEVNNLSLRLEEALSIGELYNKKINETALLMQKQEQTMSELVLAQEKVRSLSARLNEVEDTEKNVQCFKEDMNRLRFLEEDYKKVKAECEKLKEHQENVALLNEKLVSAELKLSRSEARCDKLSELNVSNESIRRQSSSRDGEIRGTALNNSFNEISQLKKEVENLTSKNQKLLNDYDQLYSKYNKERRLVSSLSIKVDEQAELCSLSTAQLSRLKKRAALLSNESNSLRSILQSYDAELTMTSHTTQLNKRLNNEEGANQRLHTRIEQLELELQKKSEELMRQRLLAKQVTFVPQKSPEESEVKRLRLDVDFTEHEKEKNKLLKEIADYKKENEILREKIEELESVIDHHKMKGEYDPRSEKILHFQMNPADSARQKFKQEFSDLKQENTRLKKKLKEIEEGRDVSISEIEVPKSVKNELAMAELRNKRLKEVFSKKIQEFRQACYSLTGYRIDASADAKFKLVSMYAESESDFLLFQMLPDGTMQLLESEFSQGLGEMISLHLHHQNSIPMFLNALTVNLFSQQTMVVE